MPSFDWPVLRGRLLGNQRVRRWALAFPPTRWIARRRARKLFDLCAGFVYSQVLAACVTLGVFDILAQGSQTAAAVGGRTGLDARTAQRLLDAACSLDLVCRAGPGRYGLGSLGAALGGVPGIAAMIAHHHLLYADLADPVALLRGEAPSRRLAEYWAYAGEGDPAVLGAGSVAPYSALMAASQAMVAAEILDAYPMRRHRRLLDIGGGDGAFLAAAAERAPDLALSLFDLPPVAERARAGLGRAGLAHRLTVTGGDFRTDPLPPGADVATLVRVVHDHDDADALALMAAARRALGSGGRLLVAEPMAETSGAEPVGHAYFGFYLLAMGSGRPRTERELTAMLKRAGFRRVSRAATRMPLVTSVLVADV